tara:strand:- start:4124 stop:5209 length:1086 start_codon:yes stop_codon:yes gene_type:complete
MDDLLKEAIADAKAVRETALENAKIALEEAFTPRLKSMLSQKIQNEVENEGMHDDDEEDVEERMHGDDEDDDMEERGMKMPRDDDDDDVEERMHGDDEEGDMKDDDEGMHGDDEGMHDDEEGMHDDEEGMHDDEEDMDEELDLESVLKELEEDLEEDVAEPVTEEDDEEEDDEKKVDENDVTSGIGAGDNKVDKKAYSSSEIGKAGKAKQTETVEEDIDLEEVLKALDEEVSEEPAVDVQALQSELAEHRDVVKYLRSKLNEVNLLNAKLLFTNKLFRSFGLSNEQKMKVVETFDRAQNVREIKLVYSTLAESFGGSVQKELKESKGSSSKPVASTEPKAKKVISEGVQLKNRFRKLANII